LQLSKKAEQISEIKGGLIIKENKDHEKKCAAFFF